MSNYRLPSIEERLCRLEAEANVGVDQVARRALKRLIDSLESQRSGYERLNSDLKNEVSALRSVVSNDVKALKRRVRELEQGA
jgi:hypothetical protein